MHGSLTSDFALEKVVEVYIRFGTAVNLSRLFRPMKLLFVMLSTKYRHDFHPRSKMSIQLIVSTHLIWPNEFDGQGELTNQTSIWAEIFLIWTNSGLDSSLEPSLD